MPRSGRGGRREGKPNTAYAQRSDLQGPKPAALPVMSPPSTGYGTTAALERQQQALPVAAPAAPAPAPVARAAPAGPTALPGSGGAFDRETDFPEEPVTAGLSTGAGPGPDLAGPDPDLAGLTPYLGALELMASSPNASAATRNLVRRLRGGAR